MRNFDESKSVQQEKFTIIEDGSRARNLNPTNEITDYSRIGMTDDSRVEHDKLAVKDHILEPIVKDTSEKSETERQTATESVSGSDLPNLISNLDSVCRGREKLSNRAWSLLPT